MLAVLTDPELADVLDTTVVDSAEAARAAVDDGRGRRRRHHPGGPHGGL